MNNEDLKLRVERLEAALLALAKSCTAEPDARIDHDAVVVRILSPVESSSFGEPK